MAIQPLLDALASAPEAVERGLRFREAQDSLLEEPAPGYLVWRWGQLQDGDRLRMTYLFDDADGGGVFISIVFDSRNFLKEIEFWRGDSKELLRVPQFDELIVPVPGKIY